MDDIMLYHPGPVLAILAVTKAYLEMGDEASARIWMKPWLRRRDEDEPPSMYTLYQELFDDGECHLLMRTLRMPPDVFEELLELLRPHITKANTNWRKSISAELRLCITLRFFCLGDGFLSLHQQFRVGLSTVAAIVYDTSKAMYQVLQPLYMRVPRTSDGWRRVASEYEEKWNLPHVLGAVDGKHVRIRKPPGSESVYHNYKQFFSLVLMAVVDANYNFLYIDVGSEGSCSDGGIWKKCSMKKQLLSRNNPLRIPRPAPVQGIEGELSYYLVGDDAFPLSTSLMKPYPGLGLNREQRIFNYRLSRCRRIVENAFGILASKFLIYRQDLRMRVDRAEDIIKATCVLHNYMRARCGRQYMAADCVDTEDEDHRLRPGTWRQVAVVEGLQPIQPRNTYQAAKDMRDTLASYCIREGSVEWQYDVVFGQ